MGTHFRQFSFQDDKSTFHYLNPDHNAIFRIPGETEVGNEFILDGTFINGSHGFLLKFQEDIKANCESFFTYDLNLLSGDVTMSSPFGDTIIEQGMDCVFKEYYFLMYIKTGSNFYEVKIDEEKPTVYEVRNQKAITSAHYISITGDIQIRSFHIQKNGIEKGIFHMSIPDNARIGDIFTFYGRAPTKKEDRGTRIIIEFLDAPGEDDNVWFHFNPRFQWLFKGEPRRTQVTRNTYIKGQWGAQENDGNPMTMGQLFKIDIVVEKEHFHCWIDDVDFCTYKHRLPFRGITNVNIYNTSEVRAVEMMSMVMNRVSCRTPKRVGFNCAFHIERMELNCVNYFPKVPVEMKLPQSLDAGSCVYISGVFKNARSFRCSLKDNQSRDASNKVVMEMTADFDRSTVMFEGDEEPICGKFLFNQKGYFHMQIYCTDKGRLLLTVDQIQLDHFRPLVDYKRASHVNISGDARINHVVVLRPV